MAEKDAQSESLIPENAVGGNTATGQELRRLEGEEEIPKGAARGAEPGPDSKGIKPDSQGPKPLGAQKQPAEFVANGSLPHKHVGSPSGPVPVSAVAGTSEEAEERLAEAQDQREASRRSAFAQDEVLPEEQVAKMSAAELRAVAQARGYDLPQAGARVTRTAFLRAQDADENLE